MNDKLREVMAEIFKIPADSVTDTLTMEDVEKWNSLSHLELVLELQDQFGVSFEPEEIIDLVSVAKIKELLGNKGIE